MPTAKDENKRLLSTPVTKVAPHYPWHDRGELAANMPPIRDIDIDDFYEFLGAKRGATAPPGNAKAPSLQKPSKVSQREPPVFGSASDFIAMVQGFLDALPEQSMSKTSWSAWI